MRHSLHRLAVHRRGAWRRAPLSGEPASARSARMRFLMLPPADAMATS